MLAGSQTGAGSHTASDDWHRALGEGVGAHCGEFSLESRKIGHRDEREVELQLRVASRGADIARVTPRTRSLGVLDGLDLSSRAEACGGKICL